MLPMVAIYLLHYASAPPGSLATGFLQADQPYYMANAQAVVAHGFSPIYRLPFSPDDSTPAVYFQPITALLGLVLLLTHGDPGTIYVGFGILAGLVMFRVTISLVAQFVSPDAGASFWLTVASIFWGGGVITLLPGIAAGLAGEPTSDILHAAYFLDPADGTWFLNLGRNVYFSVEAFYHTVFFAAVLAIIARRYVLAIGFVTLLSMSHPFTGLELILVVGAFAVVERAVSKVPIWFITALTLLLAAHLGYYLFALRALSPEYVLLQKQWMLPWQLETITIAVAYGPALLLALIGLVRGPPWLRDPEQVPIRFAVVWFLVAFLLANHQYFIAARQPLHFTRGYVWTPLALIAAPVLQRFYAKVLCLRLGAVPAIVVLVLACSDNIAWLGREAVEMVDHTEPRQVLLTSDEKAALDRLSEPDIAGRLLLSDDARLAYLATVYVPLRTWFSHPYNTPDAVARQEELERFFTKGDEPLAWRDRNLVLALTTLATPPMSFSQIAHYDSINLFVRDAPKVDRSDPNK